MIFKERVHVFDTGVFVIQVLIFSESNEGCFFPDTCEISFTFSRAFLVVLDRKVVYICVFLRVSWEGRPIRITASFVYVPLVVLNKLFVILTSFLAAILNSVARIRRFVPSDAVERFSESSTWRPPRVVLWLRVAVESRIMILFIELTDWCV